MKTINLAQFDLEQKIKEVFLQIPKDELLFMARQIQLEIIENPNLIKTKDQTQYVTKVDFQIQTLLLKYFANSELKYTYKIKTEEELTRAEQKQNQGKKMWQLIIDPLDGTSTFCKKEKYWGIMVGACNLEGNLIYSWNMISTGEVYTSEENKKIKDDFNTIKENRKVVIDVYDYNAGVEKKFTNIFKNRANLNSSEFKQISYPAAIWVGWELYNDRLDGILWLPSKAGKKNYPDYDLIFLGTLKQKGYQIRLGKIGQSIEMIAVAPSKKDIETLWNTGLEIIPSDKKESFKIFNNQLLITPAL